MKKIFVIAGLILSMTAYAQYTPLRHIEVPDNYGTQIRTEISDNISNTIETFTAHFGIGSKRFNHEKGTSYPDFERNNWNVSIKLNSEQDEILRAHAKMEEGFTRFYTGTSTIQINVGEKQYNITTWYYAADSKSLMIDINKTIAEHISVSGFQGIYSSYKEILRFSDIEQELWRRAAKTVYDKRKNL